MGRFDAKQWLRDEVEDLTSLFAYTEAEAMWVVKITLWESKYESLTPSQAASVLRLLQ
jgi:hypothetical protein